MSLWAYIRVSPILIPVVIGLFRFKEIRQFRYLFYFVGYGAVTTIVNSILKDISIGNTMFLGHMYVLVSFVLLCLFFQTTLKGYVKPLWFRVLVLGFVLLCVVQLLFFQSIKEYPSIQFSVLAMVMFVLAMVYFHKVMTEANVIKLRNEPLFWMNIALFLYYSSNLFYYLLFSLLLDEVPDLLYTINRYYFVASNAVFYLLIAIGFWKAGKQKSKE